MNKNNGRGFGNTLAEIADELYKEFKSTIDWK